MTKVLRASTIVSLAFMACATVPPPVPTTQANIRLHSQLDSDTSQYRVEGAEGNGQEDATDKAAVSALVYAAKSLAGDPTQKTAAGEYITRNLMAVMGFASKGRIFRRTFSSDGERMRLSMFVKINRSALQRHLIENEVITASRLISKGAGRPKIMVIYDQGDCSRGKTTGPLCTLPKRINEQAITVKREEEKIRTFQKTIIDAGCLAKTESVATSESSTKDKSSAESDYSDKSSRSLRGSSSSDYQRGYSASGRHSGSLDASRAGTSGQLSGRSSGRFSASGSASGRSRRDIDASAQNDVQNRNKVQIDREAQYSAFRASVRASDNCQAFLGRLTPMEARVDAAQRKMDNFQEQLDRIRSNIQKKDVASIKINEWFVNQRWEVVDANAVQQAQRVQDAMINVKGLPEDPVAALAQLAGADIYVMHGTQESHAGGGYQVHLDVRAYEVVSGKLLGSKVGKSDQLASTELENGTSQAVGRSMPKILDQITGYWSDMAREGVKSKIVLRGNFENHRIKRKINRAMDKISELFGTKCMDKCEWQPGLKTSQTITGEYTLPAKLRPRLGDYVLEALEETGFKLKLVVSNPALNIIEIE